MANFLEYLRICSTQAVPAIPLPMTTSFSMSAETSCAKFCCSTRGGNFVQNGVGRLLDLGMKKQCRGLLRPESEVQSQTGEEDAGNNVAQSDGNLIPDPPLTERNGSAKKLAGRNDEHIH